MTAKPKSAMRKNLAVWDRVLRIAVAAFILLGWYWGYLPAEFATALLVIAGALALNSAMGICGLYAFFGFSTCPLPRHKDTAVSDKPADVPSTGTPPIEK